MTRGANRSDNLTERLTVSRASLLDLGAATRVHSVFAPPKNFLTQMVHSIIHDESQKRTNCLPVRLLLASFLLFGTFGPFRWLANGGYNPESRRCMRCAL